jgi:hypothetical protein
MDRERSVQRMGSFSGSAIDRSHRVRVLVIVGVVERPMLTEIFGRQQPQARVRFPNITSVMDATCAVTRSKLLGAQPTRCERAAVDEDA